MAIEQYTAETEQMERDADRVTGTDREILATCADAAADQLFGALWNDAAAEADGYALAARCRVVAAKCNPAVYRRAS